LLVRAAAEDAWEAAHEAVRVAIDLFGRPPLDLLRCVFGDAFHPVTLGTPCLLPSVVALAAAIYEACSFERLPELAQALEQAGGTDGGVLAHLRSQGPHARGCHALDAVLGR
jgi:hypothetical protein